jgi:hypothetical protein
MEKSIRKHIYTHEEKSAGSYLAMIFRIILNLSCGAHSFILCRKQRLGWKENLKTYGLAGIIAYGLLNTVYYTVMFTYMWTNIFKVPRGKLLAHFAVGKGNRSPLQCQQTLGRFRHPGFS